MKLVLFAAVALLCSAQVSAQTCASGMVYQECGTACPLTCDNYENPPLFCTFQCVQGCFCAAGMVEHNGGCVLPTDCPGATTTEPPTAPTTSVATENTSCTSGMLYQECGTACPLTCDNYQNPPLFCTFQCVQGCFCAADMVEHNGGCVLPTDCPGASTTDPPTVATSTESPCASFFCQPGSSCTVYTPTGQAYCEPSCSLDNGGCADDKMCSLVEVQCFTAPCPPIVECMSCTNGKTYQECGSICPTTCDNHLTPPLCFACQPGCSCPVGTVLNVEEDSCVPVSDCPDPCAAYDCAYGYVCTVDEFTGQPYCNPTCDVPFHCGDEQSCSLVSVNCSSRPCPQQVVCTDIEVCSDGKIYQECGPVCPQSCETFYGGPNPCFSLRCAAGCFCPEGLLEHEGGCFEATECPNACTNGKVFEQCGTACPPTCDNYNSGPVPCTEQCVQGCFCPQGLLQSADSCVEPVDCPETDPCGLVLCQQYHYCEVSSVTGDAVCVPSCEQDNGGCRSDQLCNIGEFECFPVDGAPCDPHRYIQCKNSPYIPCRSDASDCPSNSRCLTQNTTGQSICLESCYRRNGGCDDDEVCITEVVDGDCLYGEECATAVSCLDLDEVSRQCPADQQYTSCGTACPPTCDTYLQQEATACIELCVSGCFCPFGLVSYRDRCVDPRECYSLVNSPPIVNPLPFLSDTVLLILTMPYEELSAEMQEELVASVQRLLDTQLQYSEVTVDIHAVYADENLQVVLQFSGADVGTEFSSNFQRALFENPDMLAVRVLAVTTVDTQTVPQGLSQPAIIGIAVGASVAGLAVALLAAVGAALCIVKKGRTATKPPVQGNSEAQQPVVYSKLSEEVKKCDENIYT